MVRLPGTRSIVLTLPAGVTANNARLIPLSLAVNQTSSPLGDHASPTTSDQSGESTVAFLSLPVIITDPRESPSTGCSINATCFPLGDTRTPSSQPGVS